MFTLSQSNSVQNLIILTLKTKEEEGGWKAPPPVLHHTKKLGAYRVNNESLFSETFCLRKFIQYVIDKLRVAGGMNNKHRAHNNHPVKCVCSTVGGAKYRGVFSIVGDIMSTMGNNLEYCGVFSTVGVS